MLKNICSIQRIISFIPFLSNPVIIAFTIKYMVKEKAKKSLWIRLFFMIAAAVVMFILANFVILSGNIIVLNIICSAAVSVILNNLLLPIQFSLMGKSKKEQHDIPALEALIGVGLGIVTIINLFLIIGFIPIDIEDTNGSENITPVTLSDGDLLSMVDKYHADEEEEMCSGNKLRIFLWQYYDNISFKSSDFSGLKTLAAVYSEENEIAFEIEPTLKSGNLRIIISMDGEHYSDIEVNEKTTIELHDAKNKGIRIRMAGESADVEVKVSRIN